MMRKLIICFTLLLNLVTAHTMPADQFDSLVMFGDSLTDNGNLYAYMWGYLPASPPYFEGHFSNGPVWAEYLYQDWYGEQNVGGFQDYAVGGAGAVISRKGNLPFSLSIEVDDYFYWHTYDKPSTSLFAIWIGANNYLNAPTDIDDITTSVVESIGSAVDKLVANGGNKFIIANIPDMSRSPYAEKYGNTSVLHQLTLTHNQKLYDKVQSLRESYPDLTFIFFDVQALLEDVMTQPKKYHLTNINEPCYYGTYSGWFNAVQTSPELIYSHLRQNSERFDKQRWSMIRHNPSLLAAAQLDYVYAQRPGQALLDPLQCDGHLFWDHIHPTTEVHRLIANQVKQLVKQAGLRAVMPDPGNTRDEPDDQQLS